MLAELARGMGASRDQDPRHVKTRQEPPGEFGSPFCTIAPYTLTGPSHVNATSVEKSPQAVPCFNPEGTPGEEDDRPPDGDDATR